VEPESDGHPARRRAPDRTRRRRDENDGQAPLFTLEQERAGG
jgi:hypothetical protein